MEANTQVRPDPALWQAFGFSSFPDQSTLSQTLDACTPENVATLRRLVQGIYRQAGRHLRQGGWLVLDIDLTGLICGRRAEQATRGYFSRQRGRYGRQVASGFNEIVAQGLYEGKRALNRSINELIGRAEEALGISSTAGADSPAL